MQNGKWLVVGALNQITVTLGGKNISLRKTLHQVEQYGILAKKQKESFAALKADEQTGADVVSANANAALDVCEIVLNPEPHKIEFTREQISDLLDLDQVEILSRVWLDRKLFAPRLDPDPFLSANPPGAGSK